MKERSAVRPLLHVCIVMITDKTISYRAGMLSECVSVIRVPSFGVPRRYPSAYLVRSRERRVTNSGSVRAHYPPRPASAATQSAACAGATSSMCLCPGCHTLFIMPHTFHYDTLVMSRAFHDDTHFTLCHALRGLRFCPGSNPGGDTKRKEGKGTSQGPSPGLFTAFCSGSPGAADAGTRGRVFLYIAVA